MVGWSVELVGGDGGICMYYVTQSVNKGKGRQKIIKLGI